jgi:hypothetical protein
MPTTFTKIASVTVGAGGASSIDFTSIPSTYTDLCVKISARVSSTDFSLVIKPNNSTTGFTNVDLFGTGSAVASQLNNSTNVIFINTSSTTANTFSSSEIYIPNYTASSFKSISTESVMETNATNTYAQMNAILWSNTSAITSLVFGTGSGTFVQYTTATLYGIKNS